MAGKGRPKTPPTAHEAMAGVVSQWRNDASLFVNQMFDAEPSPQQKLMLQAISKPGARVAAASGHGVGKALNIQTIVYTPNGIKRWGDLQVGDKLFGTDGKATEIIAIPFRGKVPTYRIEFDDNTDIICSGEHLWTVISRDHRKRRGGYVTLTTDELYERGVSIKNGKTTTLNWQLPKYEALSFPKTELPIHPYALGVWLGDGSYSGALFINALDTDIIEHLQEVTEVFYRKQPDIRKDTIHLALRCGKKLKELGLHGAICDTKFIPDIYKYSAIDDRWELLRGLMDTDGTCNADGSCTYSTTSAKLAEDIAWIARSLSGKVFVKKEKRGLFDMGNGKNIIARDIYRVRITMPNDNFLFYAKRKGCKIKKNTDRTLTCRIRSIEPTGRIEDCMCVTVSNPNGLFLAGDVKPCHNSTCMSWCILWGLTCFNDIVIGCTAPSAAQMRDVLLKEVAKWRDKMLEPWKSNIKITQDKVAQVDGIGMATMRTGRKESPEALQGLHAENMIFLIDEASGIDEKVFELARGSLSTPGSRILMCSNPTRGTGYFHTAFHRARDNWNLFTFSCIDSPFVSQQYIDEMRNEYGPDSDIFKVRVLGQFPSGGDLQFISTDIVDKASKRYYDEKAYDFAPLVLGVDVAYFGGDKSVIYLRQGLHARCLFQAQGIEPAALAGIVGRLWDEHKADAVFVDGTGIGAGVVSALRLLGRSPVEVMFAGAPNEPGYQNKRAECWGLMKEWLKDGWIPNEQILLDDLTAPEYSYTMTGKIILERKEDMKKRGLASTDHGDALALCFSEPIFTNHKRGAVGLISGAKDYIDKKYDPFHVLQKARRRR